MSAYFASAFSDVTPPTSSLVKTRKTHTKSRGGCRECKRRKQKCSEQKPVCAGCVKRELHCVYTRPGSLLSRGFDEVQVEPSSSTTSSESPGSLISQVAPTTIGCFGIEDMELWLHYIKHTSDATSIMFGGSPELGLVCDYLLHGMLATAAIHLGYLRPEHRAKYNLLSRQHQDIALGPFQRAMASITDDNVDCLFAYGILLVVSSLASSGGISVYGGHEPSSEITDWVIFVRGCRSIAVAAKSDIRGLPMKEWVQKMVQIRCTPQNTSKLSPEEESSFTRIGTLIAELPSTAKCDVDEVAAYLHALAKLRETFAFSVVGFNASLTVVMKVYSPRVIPEMLSKRLFVALWPLSVTDAFVRLLSEMRPLALIIMAHYCLILRRAKDCWYMDESGLRIFEAIQQNLGEEWSALIEYPRRFADGVIWRQLVAGAVPLIRVANRVSITTNITMGLLKTGIILYGAHLVAKKIYGEKRETTTENGWCQRPQPPQSEVPQQSQGLQGPPPNYIPESNVHSSQQPYQQWSEKAAIESKVAPKQCTCGAAEANQIYQANLSHDKS